MKRILWFLGERIDSRVIFWDTIWFSSFKSRGLGFLGEGGSLR